MSSSESSFTWSEWYERNHQNSAKNRQPEQQQNELEDLKLQCNELRAQVDKLQSKIAECERAVMKDASTRTTEWIAPENCGRYGNCDESRIVDGKGNEMRDPPDKPAENASPVQVCWEVLKGVQSYGFYRTKAEAENVRFHMQRSHEMSELLGLFIVQPHYIKGG